MLVPKRALDSVGGFREEFFLYYEEVELQLRLRLNGWSVRLVPTAVCGQEPGNLTAYLRVRNRILLTTAFPYYFDQRLRFSLLEAVRTCAISVRDRRSRNRVGVARAVGRCEGESGPPTARADLRVVGLGRGDRR
jgi:GT2 family glycosyltransferase